MNTSTTVTLKDGDTIEAEPRHDSPDVPWPYRVMLEGSDPSARGWLTLWYSAATGGRLIAAIRESMAAEATA